MELSRGSALALALVLLSTAVVAADRNWQEWQEFKEFQKWKRSMSLNEKWAKYRGTIDRYEDRADNFDQEDVQQKTMRNFEASLRDPPPIDKVALMARYIVNQAGWAAVSTVSCRQETENYPFVNIISISDGPIGNGSGVVYMYLTPRDFTGQDVEKDDRASLMVSLAQGPYCEKKNYDPMDPRCPRVVITGKVKTITEENPEIMMAKAAVFGRHPWLAHMPKDHKFFFAKLKMASIALLDTFGGPKFISINDYLHPPTDTLFKFLKYLRHKNRSDMTWETYM